VNGYMGKILFVNLSTGELKVKRPDEKLYREFIGGYGIGARIIYSDQRGGIDPLGPENILGFMAGPLTGTNFPFGGRYAVFVGKSPLTGGWGDANSGGDFGPYIKFSGYDGIFFVGVARKPVYLFINDGKAELRQADRLWGKDTYETDDMLRNELGKDVRVACIGPAGENLSLISCIINNKGRAAGRSGVGAVMGSKKLKAVAVFGTAKVIEADEEETKKLRREIIGILKDNETANNFRKYGTSCITSRFIESGECPVKNWAGIGIRDFPNASLLSDANVVSQQEKRYGCYRCPISCGGHMKEGTGEYTYEAGVHKPEYETLGAFGAQCLNGNLDSIIMANDLCNRYGLDTISTGGTIAFAIETYERGLITKKDTDGLELTWGSHQAIVSMVTRMAKREGFGNILADGSKVAAGRIGRGSEKYAIHIHGQELPLHDPKNTPSFATVYKSDSTPGRHLQGSCAHAEMSFRRGLFPDGIRLSYLDIKIPPFDNYTYNGKGKWESLFRNHSHLVNAAGACLLADLGPGRIVPADTVPRFLSVITGWDLSGEEISMAGQRIAAIRQAHNVREGLTPKDFRIPDRVVGNPPLTDGPLANVTVDVDTMVYEFYKAMDWDSETGKPSKKKLLELGLKDIAEELWT
jgi:aldehyde:ferredoxin oxidoreductase